jgi:hypothetical protein
MVFGKPVLDDQVHIRLAELQTEIEVIAQRRLPRPRAVSRGAGRCPSMICRMKLWTPIAIAMPPQLMAPSSSAIMIA